MSAMYDAYESPWHKMEKQPYARTSLSPQGMTCPEYVRIYASQQELSGVHCDEPNCVGEGAEYGRLYASSCDVTNGVPRQGQGRDWPRTPPEAAAATTNHASLAPPVGLSPGRPTLTLTVPGDARRRPSAQSNSTADDVSIGYATTYPPQPSVNGSMSCLTATVPLSHIDFWPACRKKALMACDATFETFE